MVLELRIEHAHSLKDRRQVVRSLKEKLAHGFNVSIAEMDEAVTWQSATIGIAAISASRDYLTGQMLKERYKRVNPILHKAVALNDYSPETMQMFRDVAKKYFESDKWTKLKEWVGTFFKK